MCNSQGVPGTAEAEDRFGTAISGDYVGVPGEDVGTIANAGLVQRWNPANPGGQIAAVCQESPGVPGTSEAGNEFGASLAPGFFGLWRGPTFR